MHRTLSVALVLAGFACPLAHTRAQDAGPDPVSPFLDRGHWSVASARRAAALGHAPPMLAWQDGSASRLHIGLMLRAALLASEEASPERAAVAQAWWARFVEEFPATAAMIDQDLAGRDLRGEGAVSVGLDWSSERFIPGFAEWIQYGGGGPLSLGSSADLDLDATWSTVLAPFLAVEASPRYDRDGWDASEAYALVRYRASSLWLGRRSLAYGPGESGGLILNANVPLTGGGILLGPSRLPWLLRYLGPVRFEGNLSRLDSSFAVKHPWLMVNHGSFSPHPRLLLGLTHGAIFAGSGRPPFNARNFLAMVLLGRAVKGSADSEFENQLVAGEIRWRPPVGSLPLELHVAWGTEDNQGAWYEVPASQFGARIAALPGFPQLSFGAERTEFEPPCPTCGNIGFNSNWYRHYIYKAGWTVDQHLLGHPLGGNGVEWLAWAHADLDDARLRLDARAYYRERGPYNLFSPDLQGYGHGGRLNVAWRLRANTEAQASFEAERLGNDDLRRAGFAGARIFF